MRICTTRFSLLIVPIKQLKTTVYFFLGSPLLWIYKDEDMLAAVSGSENAPEFHNPSCNPFYHVPTGSLSHYGDQILPILRSLAECKGTRQ